MSGALAILPGLGGALFGVAGVAIIRLDLARQRAAARPGRRVLLIPFSMATASRHWPAHWLLVATACLYGGIASAGVLWMAAAQRQIAARTAAMDGSAMLSPAALAPVPMSGLSPGPAGSALAAELDTVVYVSAFGSAAALWLMAVVPHHKMHFVFTVWHTIFAGLFVALGANFLIRGLFLGADLFGWSSPTTIIRIVANIISLLGAFVMIAGAMALYFSAASTWLDDEKRAALTEEEEWTIRLKMAPLGVVQAMFSVGLGIFIGSLAADVAVLESGAGTPALVGLAVFCGLGLMSLAIRWRFGPDPEAANDGKGSGEAVAVAELGGGDGAAKEDESANFESAADSSSAEASE